MRRRWSSVVGAVGRRPDVWVAAAGAAIRHAPRGWWRGPRAWRRAAPWLRFRVETAYGQERPTPTAAEVVTWLRWVRAWPRARR